jgi:hypothetical protein
MSLVATPSDRLLRLRIHGSESFDVGAIDLDRFVFGFSAVAPSRLRRGDLDGDGFDDFELRFAIDHLGPARPSRELDALAHGGVHCFYGASVDGTPFHGCVRAVPPGVRGAVRADPARGGRRDLR